MKVKALKRLIDKLPENADVYLYSGNEFNEVIESGVKAVVSTPEMQGEPFSTFYMNQKATIVILSGKEPVG